MGVCSLDGKGYYPYNKKISVATIDDRVIRIFKRRFKKSKLVTSSSRYKSFKARLVQDVLISGPGLRACMIL